MSDNSSKVSNRNEEGKELGRGQEEDLGVRKGGLDKPFACEHPGCDKSFTTSFSLRRHLVSHDKKKMS